MEVSKLILVRHELIIFGNLALVITFANYSHWRGIGEQSCCTTEMCVCVCVIGKEKLQKVIIFSLWSIVFHHSPFQYFSLLFPQLD